MGILDKRRERKALEAHEQRRAELEKAVEDAETVLAYAQLEQSMPMVQGVALKKGEHAHLVVEASALVEPRRLPGQWTGGSKGVSFRVAKGVNYRVGSSKGTYRQGDEVLQPIDSGTFVVTNQRFMFVGTKRSTEWQFAKLLGFSLDLPGGVAVFNVSNRQKASGVRYGTEHEAKIEAVIAASIARHQGDEAHQALLAELESDLAAAKRELAALGSPLELEAGAVEQPMPIADAAPADAVEPEPVAAEPRPAAPTVPAGWFPDPAKRFEHRYWDGTRWTSHVSTNGATQTDPIHG